MTQPIHVIGSFIIFITTFIFIISSKVDRTIITIIGALCMILFGMFFNFYSQEEALLSIDFNTIGLLMGMMIIVSVMKKTGLFSYIAVKTAKFSRGNPWRLMLLMGLVTAVISMLLDNVTTIILVIPITVLVCDILGISPLPTMMAEILLSNIGGAGTLVGDPPNMMIASASNFVFTDFLIHLMPPVAIVIIISVLVLKFIFRSQLKQTPRNVEAVLKLNESKALKDKPALIKSAVALAMVFVLFLLQRQLGLHHSFIAIIGAGATLILVRPDIDEILTDVKWSVLVFFSSLFILVGGLEHSGFLSIVADQIAALAAYNMFLAKIFLLWSSAIAASIVDRVPYTAAMIPVIKHLGSLGFDTNPLWWILALGVGFGGNGTPIGSVVGVVGISMSEKTRTPIDFKIWLKSGTIIMLISVLIISLVIGLI